MNDRPQLNNQNLLRFANTLAGHYSNKQQAMDNPRNYAHINIYFRPLNWQVFQGPGYYSEQSYNHDPWRPYRQGIHKLQQKDDLFILLNYGCSKPERLAGAGFEPSLLKELNPQELKARVGCAMHFREINNGKYRGEVEPGKACMVPRDGKLTYLVSEVEVDENNWISRDQGLDPSSNEVCWGSEHGHLCFTRIAELNELIDQNWISKAQLD